MIVALLNQKAAWADRSPPTSPASWRCAANTSSCWTPTRRVHRWTGQRRNQQGLPKVVQRRGPGAKRCIGKHQNSPGGPITSSSTARHASRHWRAPRCWRPSACDPRASQPLRPAGQRRDGGADPRRRVFRPALRAAFVINRSVSTDHRAEGAAVAGRPTAAGAARRGSLSITSSPTAWPAGRLARRRRRTTP